MIKNDNDFDNTNDRRQTQKCFNVKQINTLLFKKICLKKCSKNKKRNMKNLKNRNMALIGWETQ